MKLFEHLYKPFTHGYIMHVESAATRRDYHNFTDDADVVEAAKYVLKILID